MLQVQLLDIIIPKMSRHPAEQRKTRGDKQRLQKQMAARLETLQRWLKGGFLGFDLLDPATRALSAPAPTWTVGTERMLVVLWPARPVEAMCV